MDSEAIDWSECPIVVTVAGLMSGVPVVKGTRMPADDVVENYESGSPVDEIAENFALAPSDIRTILAYASSHKPTHTIR